MIAKPIMVTDLYAWTAPEPAKEQRQYKQDDEDDEQDFRDAYGTRGDTCEPEDSGNNGDDKKHDGPIQHGSSPWVHRP